MKYIEKNFKFHLTCQGKFKKMAGGVEKRESKRSGQERD